MYPVWCQCYPNKFQVADMRYRLELALEDIILVQIIKRINYS